MKRLVEFFTGTGGKLSSDRLWYHISYAAATIVLLHIGLSISSDPTPDKQHAFTVMMTMYLAIVAGSKFASKLISAVVQLRMGAQPDKETKNA